MARLSSTSVLGDLTVTGTVTSPEFLGDLTGNADTATLADSAIVADSAAKWTTARTITLAGDLTGNVSIDGSANVSLNAVVLNNSHTHTIANITNLQSELDGKLGVTENAVSATKWLNSRTITLIGDVTGSVAINGTTDVSMTVAVNDNSHTHTIANITNLQSELDGKLGVAENAVSASKWLTARTITLSGDVTGSVSIDGSANATLTATVVNDSHDHDGRYYTEAESDARFVNVTGDTMSGGLTLDSTSSALSFRVGNVSGNSYTTIKHTYANSYGFTFQHANASVLLNNEQGSINQVVVLGDVDDANANTLFGIGHSSNGGSTWKQKLNYTGTGELYIGVSATSRVFADNYHPNADKWTTARTISLNGAVTGSTSIDGSGNVAIATTATSDPTLTLSGDASGSATFTNLGDATLTVTIANDSHNHTTLTGITSLGFNTDASDSASISTTVDGNNTYFDFNLSDDLIQSDQWRWRFTPSGLDVFDAMILNPVSDENADLTVSGKIIADSFTGSVIGNADTATKWATARTITLNGDVSGSVSIDGSANVTLTTTVANDSHTHTFASLTSKPTTLSGYGITDAVDISSNQSIGGIKTFTNNLNVTADVFATNFIGTPEGRTPSGARPTMDAGVIIKSNSASSQYNVISVTSDIEGTGFTIMSMGAGANSSQRWYTNTSDEYISFSGTTITASLSGNATTATRLQTARTINGTSFNGTSAITTANWGTARTLTIGDTGKSVNGSGNVSWSVAEIGAAPASHTHPYLPLAGGTLTGELRMPNTFVLERTFSMIENASPQYLLLCHNAGNNNVNGEITLNRTSGNYQSANLKVIVSSGSSLLPYGTLLSLQSTQSNEEYRLVTVTVDAISWVAVKYTGNTYPMTLPGSFTGRITSNANSLTTVGATEVTDEAPLQSNKKFELNGDSIFHEGYHPNADTWTTARTITLTGGVTGSVAIDGSANVSLATTVDSSGHDHDDVYLGINDNAVSASKWQTARTITLTGDVSGWVSIDGSANVSLAATVADNSHNHDHSEGDFTVNSGNLHLTPDASVQYNATENSIDFIIQ